MRLSTGLRLIIMLSGGALYVWGGWPVTLPYLGGMTVIALYVAVVRAERGG